MADLNTNEIKTIVNFADNNLKIVKFLPDNKGNFLKRVKYQYYDYLPVMSFREIPLEDSFNVFVKRVKAATVERRGLEDLEEELVELVIC